jgi:small subunit ribosomal protein S16
LLRIRLTRVGKKKQPAYRLIVTDSRSPRDGAFLKIIGHYDPLTNPATLVVKEDEAVHWLEKGAQPSDTAAKLLTRIGVMERAGRQPVKYEGKDVPAAPKKEAKAAAEPAAAPAAAEQRAAAPEAAATEDAVAPEDAPTEEAPPESDEAPAEPEPEPEATSDEQSQEPA